MAQIPSFALAAPGTAAESRDQLPGKEVRKECLFSETKGVGEAGFPKPQCRGAFGVWPVSQLELQTQ